MSYQGAGWGCFSPFCFPELPWGPLASSICFGGAVRFLAAPPLPRDSLTSRQGSPGRWVGLLSPRNDVTLLLLGHCHHPHSSRSRGWVWGILHPRCLPDERVGSPAGGLDQKLGRNNWAQPGRSFPGCGPQPESTRLERALRHQSWVKGTRGRPALGHPKPRLGWDPRSAFGKTPAPHGVNLPNGRFLFPSRGAGQSLWE